MPVPKRRKSKSRRDMRRATHKLTAVNPSGCPRCGAPRLPHRVCIHCGFYKNVDVLRLEENI
ncbi:MAG TPA: 50S ribosomal protein L32 [bacterium]|nr:50S ribosomal protein L32 [bacterium]HKY63860.1 50S ribosomal protein L32 [bacterium]